MLRGGLGGSGGRGGLGAVDLASEYIPRDVSAAVTSFTVGGLAGDSDGGYEILGTWVVGAANALLSLRPVGLATNQGAREILVDSSVSALGGSALLLSRAGALGSEVGIRAWMGSKSGRVRFFFAEAHWKTAIGVQVMDKTSAEWTDTPTVITGLEFVTNLASGIGANSKFTVRPMRNPLL